ncbi:MAG: hypothetical protein DI598_15610 [Pseudopedobacter saltans]|uniref:HTH tetR-type domain-containing protein n=1 Tax=Pseudopedobacter saltans TaxID=151895 RepID=A0A2W5EQL9_9SPHI|nr:MAG: hypothetical protein DI598_15610 [Pseudopedobacter saltans]
MSLDKSRKEILINAQKLFQEKGLADVTVDDIARSIGKGKSSLYYYFKNKEDIFSAVLEMEINEIIRDTIKKTIKENTFQKKLEAFALTKFEMAKRRKSLYVLTETGLSNDEIQKYKQLKNNVHISYLSKEQIILHQLWEEEITSRKEIYKDDDIDTEILLFLCSLRGINREMAIRDNSDMARTLIFYLCNLIASNIKK